MKTGAGRAFAKAVNRIGFISPLPRLQTLRWIAVLGFAFLLGCGGVPKHPTWGNATGGEQYERLMWEAAHANDWKNFEHRLAPAFVGVDTSGKGFDRAGWVERWKNAGVREYSLGEITVQPEGADMVITYVLSFGQDGAKGAPGDRARVVSVWQQVKSGWILTTCSMTPMKA
jgi:Domain of unknown function (DUF4440)